MQFWPVTLLTTNPKVLQNRTKDDIFEYNYASSDAYLTIKVWTGIRLSNYSQLTDEYGTILTFEEFFQKTGTTQFISGDNFPSNVEMTKEFKLTTVNYDRECLCLCKSFDIQIWSG